MRALIVLTEEASARIVVEALWHALCPTRDVRVLEHDGKSDLARSFPRKIAAWAFPADARFVVLQDNDGGDCQALKNQLRERVPPDRIARVRIRIVMQELEAWYLGSPTAMARAKLVTDAQASRMSRQAKFRDPDAIANAKQELQRLSEISGQMAIARAIGPHLAACDNKAQSFRAFRELLIADW